MWFEHVWTIYGHVREHARERRSRSKHHRWNGSHVFPHSGVQDAQGILVQKHVGRGNAEQEITWLLVRAAEAPNHSFGWNKSWRQLRLRALLSIALRHLSALTKFRPEIIPVGTHRASFSWRAAKLSRAMQWRGSACPWTRRSSLHRCQLPRFALV